MAERAVKPFVIGRMNWMFLNTPSRAKTSCIIYSIVETAKMNHLDPYEYLKYVMEKYLRTIVAAALCGAGIVVVSSMALSDVLSGLIAFSSTAAAYMAVAGY